MSAFVLLASVSIISGCALVGWLAWLRFNERIYDKARALDVFDRTPQVARAFLGVLVRRGRREQVTGATDRVGPGPDDGAHVA